FRQRVRLQFLDEEEVAPQILALKPRHVTPHVASAESVGVRDTPREKAAAQGTVGDKADAERLAKRQDFALHVARPQRIFDLQGGERMHRMRPPDGRRPGLANAEKAHLALADKLAHRADRVLDRNGRIHPMDVIEIDDVGLEPPEALLAGFAHILRPAVREAGIAEQPEIAKLARDDVIAAVLSDRLGYELLVAATSIAVGGVEQLDPH